MSLATAHGATPAPVTPGDLAALLRQARGYLHDAPRSGQQLGAKIDEALLQWDSTTCVFPVIGSCFVVGNIDIDELKKPAPPCFSHVLPKPLTFLDIPWAGQAPEGLIGSDKFGSIIPLTSQKNIQLGELVSEAQRRSRLSVDQWNDLAQAVRDCHLESTLTHIVASEKLVP